MSKSLQNTIILFVICTSLSYSQTANYKFDHITTKQGLSHSTVSSVIQGRDGFIWIGTIDGLNRFDGYSCKVYKHNPSDSTSISSNFIHNIFLDSRGFLWMTTREGGLNKFDSRTEQFARYLHDPNTPNSIAHNKGSGIIEDKDGRLWIATDGGLDLFDPTTETFTHYRNEPSNPNSLSDNFVMSLYIDRSGTLWVGTYNGLNIFDRERQTFTCYFNKPGDPTSLSNNSVHVIYEDRSGAMWFGTKGGLNKFDRAKKTFARFQNNRSNSRSLSHNVISGIFEDSQNNFWVSTSGGGLNLFDRSTGQCTHINHEPTNSFSLAHDNVSIAFEDSLGTLWITTWGNGVDKLVRMKQKFEHCSVDPRNSNTLSNNFILSLHEDRRGALLIGTGGGGLNRLDRTTGNYTHYFNDGRTPSSLGVWKIYEDKKGILWLGTEGGGLHRFDSQTGTSKRYLHNSSDSSSISGNIVKAIYEDREGMFWIGTDGAGINLFNPGTEKFTHFPNEPGYLSSIIWTCTEDDSGNLWYGTFRHGLVKFSPTTKQFISFTHDPSNSNRITHNDVRSIHIDKNGIFWIGTYGGGVNRFDPTTGEFSSLTENDGLANNFVYGILEDDDGNLWMSTNRGISRFTPSTKQFKNFSVDDGLQAEEFNTGAYFKNNNGEMFFGGVNGFNIFHPKNIKDNPHIPPVVLTSFKVFDKTLPITASLNLLKDVRLGYNENFFSFEFAALDYIDPERNQYAHKLEGFDNGWIYIGNRHFASYTNVDPGEYILRIKGSNNDGIWNEAGISIMISITPPFWKRGWFIVSLVLFVLLATAGTARYIATRKLKRQIQELEQQRSLQQERERISRDLHDNVGAQLANIITGLEIANKQSVKGDKSKEVIQSLETDARSTITQLRETIWALRTNSMPIQKFIEQVDVFVRRQVRYRENIRYQFESNLDGNFTLSPGHVLNLYRIIQEAITNCLKHAEPSIITIRMKKTDSTLSLEIEDNGKGFSTKSQDELNGNGLLNIRHRVSELNGEFNVKSTAGKGTTIEITLPLSSPNTHNGVL
jgi:signal transduction histidine kinase/ligand-binding sensor domain-containing protein